MKELFKIKNPRTAMEHAWNDLMDDKGVTKERYGKSNKKKRPYKGKKNRGRSTMERPKEGLSKKRKVEGRPPVDKKEKVKRDRR